MQYAVYQRTAAVRILVVKVLASIHATSHACAVTYCSGETHLEVES